MELKKTMKGFLMILTGCILLYLVYKACKIDTLTHLSDSDLEWMGFYNCGDTLLFQNDTHSTDTMIVIDKEIFNSKKKFMNPFLKFETGGDYRAYSYLDFYIRHPNQVYECSFFVYKENMDCPPYVKWWIGNYVSKHKMPVGLLSCMIGDSVNSEYLDNHYAPKDRGNDIESFQWCKNQGLVWYTLKNGNTYRLVSASQKSN